MRVRPAVLGVVLLAAVLQVGTAATGAGWLSLASGAVLALLATSLLCVPRLSGLQAVRRLPVRGSAGDEVPTVLLLANTGRRASSACTAVDELPGHASLRLSLPALLPGERVEVGVDRLAVRRASGGGGVLRLEASSPFGLLRVRRDVAVEGAAVVHPARVPVPAGLLDAVPGAGAGRLPVSRPGSGTEVLGLRAWRAGESARAVSPRASARHGRPLVLEREADADPTLVVLVSAGAGEHWERALEQAAALGGAAARSGEVVLLGVPAGPHPGPAQVRDALAAAELAAPLAPAALDAALRRAGPGGAVAVVVGAAGAAELCRGRASSRVRLVVLDGTGA